MQSCVISTNAPIFLLLNSQLARFKSKVAAVKLGLFSDHIQLISNCHLSLLITVVHRRATWIEGARVAYTDTQRPIGQNRTRCCATSVSTPARLPKVSISLGRRLLFKNFNANFIRRHLGDIYHTVDGILVEEDFLFSSFCFNFLSAICMQRVVRAARLIKSGKLWDATRSRFVAIGSLGRNQLSSKDVGPSRLSLIFHLGTVFNFSCWKLDALTRSHSTSLF